MEEELPPERERVLRWDESFGFNVELVFVGDEVWLVGDGELFAPRPVNHRLRAVSAFKIYTFIPKPIHKRNRFRFVFKVEPIVLESLVAVEFECRFEFDSIVCVFLAFYGFGFCHWRI